jgi:hypothetical protein
MKKSLSARCCFLGELLSILCNRHFAPATAQLDRSARSAVRYRSQLSHHAARNSADFTLRLSSDRFHDASTNENLHRNPASKNPVKTSCFQWLKTWLRGHATPDPGETETKMRKAPLPERLRLYRKDRWLRGHATPDSCDWWRAPFRSWRHNRSM